MTDTIRQSGKLCEEIRQHCASHLESVVDTEQSRQRKSLDAIARKKQALEVADATAPAEWMADTLDRLQREREENVTTISAAFKEAAQPAIAAWLDSDESLEQLKSTVKGLMDESCERFLADEEMRLTACARSAHAGFSLSSTEAETFAILGIDLPSLADESLSESASPALDPSGQAPDLNPFPVRMGFTDKLLFRSPDAVRKRLFKDPAQAIPARTKRGKLQDNADEAILALAEPDLKRRLEQLSAEVGESAVDAYVEGVSRRVQTACAKIRKDLDGQESNANQTLARLTELKEKYRGLSDLAEEVSATVHDLEEKHAPELELTEG